MEKRKILGLSLVGLLIIGLIIAMALSLTAPHKRPAESPQAGVMMPKSFPPAEAPMGMMGPPGMPGALPETVAKSLPPAKAPMGMMGTPEMFGAISETEGSEFQVASAVPEDLSSHLVIKTGELQIVVKNVQEAMDEISRYAERKGGWVVSKDVNVEEGALSGEITVRVPAQYFEEAFGYIRGLADKVNYESVKGEDVTEEYVDLRARLKNLEATEAQLLKIMQRAGRISDVLTVFRELSSVREEIEKVKGRIQYLEQSARMSTISVKLSVSEELLPIPPAERWRPGYVIKRAWRSALLVLRALSYVVLWILAYGIIWIPLCAIIWWIRRSRKTNGSS